MEILKLITISVSYGLIVDILGQYTVSWSLLTRTQWTKCSLVHFMAPLAWINSVQVCV